VLLGWGLDVTVSALDSVWRDDPGPRLAALLPPAGDLALCLDGPAPPGMGNTVAGLLPAPGLAADVGAGALFARAGAGAVQALAEVAALGRAQAQAGMGPTAAAAAAALGQEGPGFPAAALRAWLRRPGAVFPAADGTHLLSWVRLDSAPRGAVAALAYILGRGGPRRVGVALLSPALLPGGYAWFVQRGGAAPGADRGGGPPGQRVPLGITLSRSGVTRHAVLHRMREAQW
jgi:hypothetical protein